MTHHGDPRDRLTQLEFHRQLLEELEDRAFAAQQELGIICSFQDEEGAHGTVNDSEFSAWFQRRIEDLDEQINEQRQLLDVTDESS
ncbi:hypothetical protein [Kocuria sp. HSID16901]|uniref:hypothetical protein n=1 Tax=Kocuria sp. HSID16901 TaxID=2419505 RepID=UPI000F87336A|nr:hypothetical protein [Kocuria sp. HSID16901]RUQ19581.1 hypothetical protein D8M21_11235 [Kocuria sp. HSID16901]